MRHAIPGKLYIFCRPGKNVFRISGRFEFMDQVVTKFKGVFDMYVLFLFIFFANVSKPAIKLRLAHSRVVVDMKRFVDIG